MDEKQTARKHNYPMDRKPRDTSYSETYRLATEIGLDTVFES